MMAALREQPLKLGEIVQMTKLSQLNPSNTQIISEDAALRAPWLNWRQH